jgi:hypothetical protein
MVNSIFVKVVVPSDHRLIVSRIPRKPVPTHPNPNRLTERSTGDEWRESLQVQNRTRALLSISTPNTVFTLYHIVIPFDIRKIK